MDSFCTILLSPERRLVNIFALRLLLSQFFFFWSARIFSELVRLTLKVQGFVRWIFSPLIKHSHYTIQAGYRKKKKKKKKKTKNDYNNDKVAVLKYESNVMNNSSFWIFGAFIILMSANHLPTQLARCSQFDCAHALLDFNLYGCFFHLDFTVRGREKGTFSSRYTIPYHSLMQSRIC